MGIRVRLCMLGWNRLSTAGSAGASSPLRCGLVVPTLGTGGLEEVVGMLATGLPALGIETTVLCTHGGGAIAERLQAAGVPVTVAEGSSRAWRSWARRARPTVLSTHFAPPDAVTRLAQWAPVVETVHNTYVWLSPPEWALERAKCATATSLVAVSATVAAYHRRAVGPFDMTVIPNGVQDTRLVTWHQPAARTQLGLGTDDIVFVHVGRFCVQKNQAGLVDAFVDVAADEPRARLLLVGGQDDSRYVELVRARAGAATATGAVRLLPATPDPGLVLAASDAFVSNSFFEGWSLAATEALWLGRPVLLSDTGGARELIGEGEGNGVLVPNPGGDPATLTWQQVEAPADDVTVRNREAMRHAVHAFVSHRERWAERSTEIMRDARARFSADRMTAAYAAVLRAAART